jgi:hypothetical protein
MPFLAFGRFSPCSHGKSSNSSSLAPEDDEFFFSARRMNASDGVLAGFPVDEFWLDNKICWY